MKKPISLVLAVIMALTCLTTGTSVFAGDGAKTVNAFISAQMAGNFVAPPTELSIASDLSDTYAAQVGFNDSSAEPTLLDAAIAAHIDFMGEDFMDFAPLAVSAEGWITDFFGNGSNLFYYQNGVMAGALTQTLSDGDYIDFDFLVDTSAWSDQYVFADSKVKNLFVNDTAEFTFTASTWSGNVPAAGLDINVDGVTYGKTDANGKIALTFKEFGEHFVSSANKLGETPVFMPYCTVNVSTKLNEYVKKQEAGAAAYLFDKAKAFGIDDSYDLVTLIRSGYDAEKFAAAYAASVKENLDANGGKIITSASGEAREDLGLYGAVIICLEELGFDPTDFYSYNIENAMNSASITDARPHQYHYKYAVETATPLKAKAIIKDLIDTYYTKGKGMENWGYSCDNACHFLITIAPYAESYKEYVEDAKSVIKSYLLEDGAYCDPVWSNKANTNSTALSMAAFASVNDVQTAFSYYKLLTANFENKTGIFTLDGNSDAYATKDALFSLYYFREAAADNSFEHPEHINTVIKGTPATFKKAGKTDGACCKICGHTVAQKKIAKLKAAKLKKVTKGKKRFTAKWKKVKGVDGYQIRYSTSRKFKNKKTVTVKKAKTVKKTVKKLKAKKVYYVKIRAYKTINGKKQYSKWSKAKKVKTK